MADLEQRIKDLAQATGVECKDLRALIVALTNRVEVVPITQANYNLLTTEQKAGKLFAVSG